MRKSPYRTSQRVPKCDYPLPVIPPQETQKVFSVSFRGKNLKTGEIIHGVARCDAWHLEDAAQQAMEPSYWTDQDILWDSEVEFVGNVEAVGISLAE